MPTLLLRATRELGRGTGFVVPAEDRDRFRLDVPHAERVEDIPDDFVPDVLGRRTDVISAIVDEVAFADFTDPSWGHIDTPEFSIEVNLSDDPVRHFALHLRGGDIAPGLIGQILHRLDAHALDPQSETGLFSTDTAPASLQRWRAYRDAVIHPH